MMRLQQNPLLGLAAASLGVFVAAGCGFASDVSFGDDDGTFDPRSPLGPGGPGGPGPGGSSGASGSGGASSGQPPPIPVTCNDGIKNGEESDVDCGASCSAPCNTGLQCGLPADCKEQVCTGGHCQPPTGTDGVKNGDESGLDCGGVLTGAARCAVGDTCVADTDCESNGCHLGVCIAAPSCVAANGGSTCGAGEVGSGAEQHESCCTSIEVPAFADATHPGKRVFLDKYEITAGRMRAFVEAMTAEYNGQPDINAFITQNQPAVWTPAWTKWMPSGTDFMEVETPNGGAHGTGSGCGASCNVGTNYIFGAALYQYSHGHNCYHGGSGSYAFSTYWYPNDVMQNQNGGNPRAYPQDALDVKSLNCTPSVMLQAFCAWDGGQLATHDVLTTVGTNLAGSGIHSSDGTQLGDYYFPYVGGNDSDDAARVAAPGRYQADATTYNGAGPWMDLRGNLNEISLDGAAFTVDTRFGGLGESSAHAGGNDAEWLSHPEYKSALSGGRCMRFKD